MKRLLFVSSMLFLMLGCEDSFEPKMQDYPIIETHEVTDISSTGALFTGEILQNGKLEIVEHGFLLSDLKGSVPVVNALRIKGRPASPLFALRCEADLMKDVTYSVRAYAKTSKDSVFSNAVKFVSSGTLAPSVSAVIPAQVSDGDTVVIQGEHFGTNSSVVVEVGTEKATIVGRSATQLTIVIPVNPTSGPKPLKISSLGQSTTYNGLTVMLPVIESFTPVSGPAGTIIEIKGKYFSKNPQYNKVTVGPAESYVYGSTGDVLTLYLEFSKSSGYFPVEVDVNGKKATSNTTFFINGPFITSVSPLVAKYKDVITISGQDFGFNVDENSVTIGGLKANIISATPQQITVEVPNLPETYSDITIKVGPKETTHTEKLFTKSPWSAVQNTPYPAAGRGAAVSFMIGDRFFLTSGRMHSHEMYITYMNMEDYKDTWEFSLQNGWQRRADFPDNRYLAMAFSIGNKAYVGAGVIGESLQSDFYEYNSSTDSWRKVSSMPGTGRAAGIAFSINGKGYGGFGKVAGGIKSSQFFEYDPAADTWTQIPGPAKGAELLYSFVLNDKGYIVIDGKELWEFNPVGYVWTRKSDFPDTGTYSGLAFTINGKAYAGTGLYLNGYTNYSSKMFAYDPATDQWTEVPGFDALQRNQALAFSMQGKGYVVTGISNPWPYYHLTDFWQFDPDKID